MVERRLWRWLHFFVRTFLLFKFIVIYSTLSYESLETEWSTN